MPLLLLTRPAPMHSDRVCASLDMSRGKTLYLSTDMARASVNDTAILLTSWSA